MQLVLHSDYTVNDAAFTAFQQAFMHYQANPDCAVHVSTVGDMLQLHPGERIETIQAVSGSLEELPLLVGITPTHLTLDAGSHRAALYMSAGTLWFNSLGSNRPRFIAACRDGVCLANGDTRFTFQSNTHSPFLKDVLSR